MQNLNFRTRPETKRFLLVSECLDFLHNSQDFLLLKGSANHLNAHGKADCFLHGLPYLAVEEIIASVVGVQVDLFKNKDRAMKPS